MAADGEACHLARRPLSDAERRRIPASRPASPCPGRPRPPQRRATGSVEDGGPAARSCRGRRSGGLRALRSRGQDGPWLPGAPRVLLLPWRSFLQWQLLAGATLAAASSRVTGEWQGASSQVTGERHRHRIARCSRGQGSA
jgi:hypothetical protein